jgi:CBS-domain-containing membrane protein
VNVGEVVTRDVISLRCDEPLEALLSALDRSPQDVFPVLDPRDRVVGTVSEQDLIRVLHPASRTFPFGPQKMMREGLATEVEDVMTPNPATVRPDDTLEQALKRMHGLDLPELVVVDAEGCLVGLLHGRDIYRALIGRGG